MKIYSTLQIGDFHLNHCEDYFLIENPGTDRTLMAVMDGCTMARDSYFVSTLVARILRKICITQGYQELYRPGATTPSLEEQLKQILAELMHHLKQLQSQLLLEQKDLLTTLILFLADKKQNNGFILAIGDGLISVNGTVTVFDQDNKPDYLGFHLHENFNTWYDSLHQKVLVEHIHDVSIATDGIMLFQPIHDAANTETDPMDFLLHDLHFNEYEDMLDRKLKTLEHLHGLKPADDIAVVRVIYS
ncbi:protein phosphatase 2C domain-containing protein [Chitinophaga varians]|uniref:protein phosphatase 2C domain-containing protein n=1 Tax=Chitinophaga varians TaxID=2202339 RepID=UPI00165ECF11|nr:protein phosphatase 2C domain-containing protein [Chitinophaga varians]MBC9909076.1 protein phosphatase 2C domain-containing protein [Chitinophaga varians]